MLKIYVKIYRLLKLYLQFWFILVSFSLNDIVLLFANCNFVTPRLFWASNQFKVSALLVIIINDAIFYFENARLVNDGHWCTSFCRGNCIALDKKYNNSGASIIFTFRTFVRRRPLTCAAMTSCFSNFGHPFISFSCISYCCCLWRGRKEKIRERG